MIEITFLGTSEFVPTQQRNPTSILINREGDRLLFDVGEGTQRQMMQYETGFTLSAIFLTRTEVDHTAGIIPLLRTLDDFVHRENKLEIYTPEGTIENLDDIHELSRELSYSSDIYELKPGEAAQFDGYKVKGFETETSEVSIGYALIEESRKGRFNREKAENLGVPPGPLFGRLHEGESVTLDDGTTVHPDQVVGEPRIGRRIVYTGDTRPLDTTINIAGHADLLIHEATFDESLNERATETGHSTALEAAKVAESASAKRLALTNISPRYTGKDYILKREAESIYENELYIARDGLTLHIPYPNETQENSLPTKNTKQRFHTVSESKEDLREQIRNLREIAEHGYLDAPQDEIDDLVSALERVTSSINDSVMILGSYDGDSEEELAKVKEEVVEKGYDANLAKDLPEYDDKSLKQNISVYMMMSRFCIMIDEEPSGHLNEYELAEKQHNILARLVPEDSGSTWMLGGEEEVDINHIKSFDFSESPLERLSDAIDWAEEIVEERRMAYEERYPWRGNE